MIEYDTIETGLLHFGEEEEHPFGAMIPPIVQTSLFTYPNLEWRLQGANPHGYDYSRVTNPTVALAERKIAYAEGAEGALCFGSGMGAISASMLSNVQAGDHIIALETNYPPALQLIRDYLPRFQVSHTLVKGTTIEEFEQALRPNTKLIYLETPSSMFLHLQDLESVAQLAKKHGLVTICDNSWATPIFQSPIALGIDVVTHSATKYLGGHSDIVAGVAAGSASQIETIQSFRNMIGSVLDPFAAWLLIRGLRTLPVRMERHQRNGLQVAQWLSERPEIDRVNHPGLASHPQHALAQKQMRGYGSLFSIEFHPITDEQAKTFVNSLCLFRIGCSWGGFESLVLGWPMEEAREGKRRWFIRLFVGLENVDDLIRDLEQAIQKAF
jgi:cystathionine beta-lyase